MLEPHGDRRLRRRPLGRYRYVRLRWRILFAIIDFLGGGLFVLARKARSAIAAAGRRMAPRTAVLRRRAADLRRHEPRAILLIQLDHLGDAVITRVMVPLLRRRYPGASIEVLAGAWNRELFEAMPEVDRVHVSEVNRFSRRGRLGWILSTLWWGWKLRRRRIDLGIDVRGEFAHSVVLWLAGAQRRLGWQCGGGGFLLTDSPAYVHGRPEVESRLALLAQLGIRPQQAEGRTYPRFEPPEVARRSIAARWAKLRNETGISTDSSPPRDGDWRRPGDPSSAARPVAAVHVGAGTEAKRWPVEHWRALTARMLDRGWQVVLVGGPGERIIARQIAGPRPRPGLADWTGQLTVLELAALLEQADLLVGGDSGPAHLAAAVGTPAVVLFSGTNEPEQWRPRGPAVAVVRRPVACSPCHRHRCPLADHPCMSRLLPDKVMAAIEARMKDRVTLAGKEPGR